MFTPQSAGIAQLVEHDLAKVGVASSNLVSRSNFGHILVSPYEVISLNIIEMNSLSIANTAKSLIRLLLFANGH